MELKQLKAGKFKQMMNAGSRRLSENRELVDSLNVFPVPDGDTGTNMNMSLESGVEYLNKSDSEHVGELSQALSKGLLMGARGNSGVILSQIFRGFSQAIKDEAVLDAKTFASAFVGAVDAAYKAVMKPVEGTILTVARESAKFGERKAEETEDIIEVMTAIVEGANLALEQTPELLPVLKQVGVVDSGGKGLTVVYEGFLAALTGQEAGDSVQAERQHSHAVFDEANENPLSMDDITYGYCTEIMVRIGLNPTSQRQFDYEAFRQALNELGDSLLVVADEEIIKVHVHTEEPGRVMAMGQQYGELVKIKVDNMREQVRALEAEEVKIQSKTAHIESQDERQPFAVVSVAAGQGMIELLQSIGIQQVIEGGQTMNPSTEDFVKAIEQTHADQVIILPNNKNIQMAAEQAVTAVDIPVAVVPSRSIPQGISAMLAFSELVDLDDNVAAMTEMLSEVTTGSITYAVRDTEIDGLKIKKDDYMGLIDGDIVLSQADAPSALHETLVRAISDDTEIVTLFVGEDGDMDVAEAEQAAIEADYEAIEVEVIQTDQPVYPYIFAVE